MTLDEILAELNKLDRQQVVGALQAQAQPIFQAIFDKGHSTATAKAVTDRSELESKIVGLNTTITQKDQQITELSAKAPDVAALTTKYEGQISQLKNQYKLDLEARDSVLVSERQSRLLSDLRSKLVAGGVDADYADVLVNKSSTTKRFKPNKEGKIDVLQADSEAPVVAATGKDVLDVIAEELKTGVPSKFVVATSDSGSEVNGQGKGTSRGGNIYAEIRNDAKKRSEDRAKTPSVRERMGIK
jgi:hypothetical protein